MYDVTTFQYQSHQFRSLTIDGNPWFVAKDICDILELTNNREAIRSLDEEDLMSGLLTSGGQNREMKLVSEPGLYHLIFKSRTDAAKKFKRWVAHEVLPAIRKNGHYSLASPVWSGPLTTNKLQEVAIASRNAAKIVRAHGLSYNRLLKRKLVNDLVIEATGYDVFEKLRSTGSLPDNLGKLVSPEQTVEDYLLERCTEVDNCRVLGTALYNDYCTWLTQYDEKPVSRKFFGSVLVTKYSRIKSHGLFYYIGLTLKKEEVSA